MDDEGSKEPPEEQGERGAKLKCLAYGVVVCSKLFVSIAYHQRLGLILALSIRCMCSILAL